MRVARELGLPPAQVRAMEREDLLDLDGLLRVEPPAADRIDAGFALLRRTVFQLLQGRDAARGVDLLDLIPDWSGERSERARAEGSDDDRPEEPSEAETAEMTRRIDALLGVSSEEA